RISDIYNTIHLIQNDEIDWRLLRENSLKYGVESGLLLYLSYLQKIAYRYHIDFNIERHRVKNWPHAVADKNMHFRFPLFSTGIRLYSKKIFSDIHSRNFYSIGRILLIIPFACLHYWCVKLFGRSKIW
ncbi:MAG: hypothetical protein JSW40_09615, partial [Candidatus Omnitrophota bacterium]